MSDVVGRRSSRCSGSAVREPHVHCMSIRYSRQICNTRGCRATRHTTISLSSVSHACTLVPLHPHIAYTYLPMQRSAVRICRTPQSVSLLNDYANTPRHQPRAPVIADACLGAPDCLVAIVPEPRAGTFGVMCTLGREPRVLWGESPCTLGRGYS